MFRTLFSKLLPFVLCGSLLAQQTGVQTGSGSGGGGGGANPATPVNGPQYAASSTTFGAVTPNASTTRKFLVQSGNGTTAAAPTEDVLVSGDLPLATSSTAGAVTTDQITAAVNAITTTTPLIAYYKFKGTSGTVEPDYSGSGNAGTIVGSPVRDGTGYVISNTSMYVQAPTQLSVANSYLIVVDLPILVPGVNSNLSGTPIIGNLTSSTAPLLIATGNGNLNRGAGSYGATVSAGATAIGQSTNEFFAGPVALLVTCPASLPPVIYLNGVPTSAGVTSGTTSCNNTGAGNLTIGYNIRNNNASNSYKFHAFMAFNGVLTAAQAAQVSAIATKAALAQGMNDLPRTYPLSAPVSMTSGTSIPCGFGLTGGTTTCVGTTTASNAYPATTETLRSTPYRVINYSIPNSIVEGITNAAPYGIDQYCKSSVGGSFAAIDSGTNNFNNLVASVSPQYVADLIFAWSRARAAAGCRVIIMGMVSRTGNATGGAVTNDAEMLALNAILRVGYRTKGWAVAFWDAQTQGNLGGVGAYANPIVAAFQADGVHPALLGHNIIATDKAAIEDALDGSTPDGMNPTPITTSTYSLTTSDGGLNFDSTSNNIVATLTTAKGWTGRRIKLCNITSSGSNTVTVNAPSGFPFNGISGNTSFQIAQSSCALLETAWNRDTTPAGAGAFWRTY